MFRECQREVLSESRTLRLVNEGAASRGLSIYPVWSVVETMNPDGTLGPATAYRLDVEPALMGWLRARAVGPRTYTEWTICREAPLSVDPRWPLDAHRPALELPGLARGAWHDVELALLPPAWGKAASYCRAETLAVADMAIVVEEAPG